MNDRIWGKIRGSHQWLTLSACYVQRYIDQLAISTVNSVIISKYGSDDLVCHPLVLVVWKYHIKFFFIWYKVCKIALLLMFNYKMYCISRSEWLQILSIKRAKPFHNSEWLCLERSFSNHDADSKFIRICFYLLGLFLK